MEAGRYTVEIIDVGASTGGEKRFVWVKFNVLGKDAAPETMRFYFVSEENARISRAQIRRLGATLETLSELIGTQHELDYGPGTSKDGKTFWNWNLPSALEHRPEVLDEIKLMFPPSNGESYTAPAKPAAKPAARGPAAKATVTSPDDSPF
jgi:hypothetical protein